MKRQLLIVCLVLLFSLTIVLAINNLTKEQKEFYNVCKKNCSTAKMLEKRDCNIVAFDCKNACKETKLNCSAEYSAANENCITTCDNMNITGNLTQEEIEKIKSDCKKNCSMSKKESKNLCNEEHRNCGKACQDSKNECKKMANEDAWSCKENCLAMAYQYSENETNSSTTSSGKIFCPKIRPTVCADLYDPVCSNRNVTYSNGCAACADKKVRWYSAGAC